jgi:uncharacterized repeat protein (TIGR01451 family)
VTKDEPSAEGEVLRGVHDHQVVVTSTGDVPAYDVTAGDQPDAELTDVNVATVAGRHGQRRLDRGGPRHHLADRRPDRGGRPRDADLHRRPRGGRRPARRADHRPHRRDPALLRRAGRDLTANPGTVYKDYTDGRSDSTQVVLDCPTFTTVKNVGASGGATTGTAEVGQDFTWRLTVTNTSGTAGSSAVHITDTLPANWAYRANSATVTPGGRRRTPSR